MPRRKDLKRIIRKRMEKTGEAYTTARAHTLEHTGTGPENAPAEAVSSDAPLAPGQGDAPAAAAPAVEPAAAVVDLAAIAGMSDDAVRAKTGRDWHGWLAVLDEAGAVTLPHGDIARIIHEQHGVDGWWSQTVTVGYERIRGLRDRGQRRGGDYEANRTRTFPVSAEVLFAAITDEARRREWLTGVEPVLRTARRPKSVRLGWPDGTLVAFWITPKGDAKCSVSVQHMKLPDRASVDALKAGWAERLDALGVSLARAGAEG